VVVGERAFGELELAEQHRAGFAELAHDGRVDGGNEVLVQRHAGGGRDAFGPAQVLDGDRNAVQLREDLAPADHLLGGARLRERELGRDERVRLQRRIDALDPAEHRLGELDRRDLARGEQARELFDREIVELVGHRAIVAHGNGAANARGVSRLRCEATMRRHLALRNLRDAQQVGRAGVPNGMPAAMTMVCPRWRAVARRRCGRRARSSRSRR
jgi:hypothetical protein